jgi:hypothetical protein
VLAFSTRQTASGIARRLHPHLERQNCNPLVFSLVLGALTLELTLLAALEGNVRVISHGDSPLPAIASVKTEQLSKSETREAHKSALNGARLPED